MAKKRKINRASRRRSTSRRTTRRRTRPWSMRWPKRASRSVPATSPTSRRPATSGGGRRGRLPPREASASPRSKRLWLSSRSQEALRRRPGPWQWPRRSGRSCRSERRQNCPLIFRLGRRWDNGIRRNPVEGGASLHLHHVGGLVPSRHGDRQPLAEYPVVCLECQHGTVAVWGLRGTPNSTK